MIVGAADLSKGDLAPLQRIIDPALMICIMLSHPFRKKRGKDGARCGISFGPNQ